MAWSAAGLVAVLVLAVVVLGGGGSTNEAEGAAPSTHFSDPGAEEWLPESPAADSSGPETNDVGNEPSLLNQAFDEEDWAVVEEGDSNGLGFTAGGTDPFKGRDVPGGADVGFRFEVPETWSVEEDPSTDVINYLSDEGPDPLALYVLPAGPAVGNQLGDFTQFMVTAMEDQGVMVSPAEPVKVGGRPALHLSVTKPGNNRPGAMWLLDAGPNLYLIVAEMPADPATRVALSDDLEAAVQSFDVSDG